MNEILIHLGEDGWLATYDGPHCSGVVAAFGSCTVLTAFTAYAPLELVLAEIRRLNPTVDVRPWS